MYLANRNVSHKSLKLAELWNNTESEREARTELRIFSTMKTINSSKSCLHACWVLAFQDFTIICPELNACITVCGTDTYSNHKCQILGTY